MNNSDPRIPKEMAPEVFALASRLHAQQDQSYSLSELIEAGAEAKIPPEIIRQAVQQIQLEDSQVCRQREKLKVAVIAVGVVVASVVFLASGGQMAASGCHSMMRMTGEQLDQSR